MLLTRCCLPGLRRNCAVVDRRPLTNQEASKRVHWKERCIACK